MRFYEFQNRRVLCFIAAREVHALKPGLGDKGFVFFEGGIEIERSSHMDSLVFVTLFGLGVCFM